MLKISSPLFGADGKIPVKYSFYGEDCSPAIHLENISPKARSVAVMFTAKSFPFMKNFPHWVIWNIPVANDIPEGIPYGDKLPQLGGAVQGLAYGKHRYKGPRPLTAKPHEYTLDVYILDKLLNLPENSRRTDLRIEMKGHILQHASLKGCFTRPKKK